MEIWFIAAISAATLQTARFALQKSLNLSGLSAVGATFARFVFAAPALSFLLLFLLSIEALKWPDLAAHFWIWAAIGGLAQIAATSAVVAAFSHRSFAAAIAFKKTEILQAALFGLLLFGEALSFVALSAILLGFIGVIILSDPDRAFGAFYGLGEALRRPAARYGLLAGALFGLSAVSFRQATLAVGSDDPFLRAFITLSLVTAFQAITLAIWLRFRQPGQVMQVVRRWRGAALIGVFSVGGSFCWFTAFTLQNAAIVNAVGQIELILSSAVSYVIFKERISKHEYFGMALITLALIALIYA